MSKEEEARIKALDKAHFWAQFRDLSKFVGFFIAGTILVAWFDEPLERTALAIIGSLAYVWWHLTQQIERLRKHLLRVIEVLESRER